MKLAKIAFAAVFLGAIVSSPAVHAHSDKGPHGGIEADFDLGHAEFTHSADAVTIFIHDTNDTPIKTAKSSGKIVIQSGGKTAQKQLTPVGPNKLVAKLDAPLLKGAVVVLSATINGAAVQARYTVD